MHEYSDTVTANCYKGIVQD